MAENSPARPNDPCWFREALTDAEQKVVDAAFTGTVADLWPEDIPSGQRTPDNEESRKHRTLRAEFLFCLLVGNQWPIHPRGVQIDGGYAPDRLDLTGAEIVHRVILRNFLFDHVIVLEAATTCDIFLTGSHARGVNGDRLSVKGDLRIDQGFASTAPLRLLGAEITGLLGLQGAHLSGEDGPAVVANGITVGGGVFMRSRHGFRFTAHGEISLIGARIGGQLTLSGALLNNSGRLALNAESVEVGSSVFMDTGDDGHHCTAHGEVRFLGARVGGQLSMNGGQLTNPTGHALNADGATINGSVFMRPADGHRFTATGEVSLLGTHIGGQLSMNGAQLTNPTGTVLDAEGAIIDGGLLMIPGGNHRFTATGEVRLLRAHISSVLSMNGARLDAAASPDGDALCADGATIDGDVFMNTVDGHRFTASGQIRLPGAHIRGQLDMIEAELTNPTGSALNVDGATIDGPLFFKPKVVEGTVSLSETSTGPLVDDSGTWSRPLRLRLDGFTYRSLAPGTEREATHRVNTMVARSAPFSTQPYTHLAHTYRQTGDRAAARYVTWRMHWAEHHETMGKATWLTRCIRHLPGIKPRPTATHDLDPDLPYTPAPRRTRLARRVLGHGVGFGYRFLRPLVAAAVLLAIGCGVFHTAIRTDALVPTGGPITITTAQATTTVQSSNCTDAYPCAQAFLYSLDALLPVLDLGQDQHWAPNVDATSNWGEVARWWSLFVTIAGWAIIGVVLGGAAERLRDPT